MQRFVFRLLPLLLMLAAAPAFGQNTLPADIAEKIDKLAADTLARTGVPSASIAVVKDGKLAYVKAYGKARMDPAVPATPEMRYSIGSVSKQFTAAALLLLQEQGKLSMNDKVAKYLPSLTRANEVTIRQLLSHTSGYQDYWPQDYVMPMMLKPTTAQSIMDRWAKIPLDFEPGAKWQYSNTNYVIAGAIIEKVSGKRLLQFLREKIFQPLNMKSVLNIDEERLGDTDPVGYLRFALGPPRPAPKEGNGWLFAAGELAMTAHDLALWNQSIISQSLLKPASYREMQTEVLLSSGVGTHYGLGVDVNMQQGWRVIAHGGEVSGFVTQNMVFPDEKAAIAVVTNQDASSAAATIARGIAPLVLTPPDPNAPSRLEQAKKIFAGLQQGNIDRSLFTDNANAYFSEQALKDFAASLGPLGTPVAFMQTGQGLRGGMVSRSFVVRFPNKAIRAWTFEMPDGKLEQFQVAELQ